MVAKIYIDGKYLNQMIVAEGLAWWYQRHAPKDDDLRKAENDARAAKNGYLPCKLCSPSTGDSK